MAVIIIEIALNAPVTGTAKAAATPPSSSLLSTNTIYSLILDGKTYPIKYQITGIGTKLNSMTAKVDKTALILNIVSPSNGKLIIELPKVLTDSEIQGTATSTTNVSYSAFEDGIYKPVSEIKNANSQTRILSIDFNKGTKQIEIDGSNIGVHLKSPSQLATKLYDEKNIKEVRQLIDVMKLYSIQKTKTVDQVFEFREMYS